MDSIIGKQIFDIISKKHDVKSSDVREIARASFDITRKVMESGWYEMDDKYNYIRSDFKVVRIYNFGLFFVSPKRLALKIKNYHTKLKYYHDKRRARLESENKDLEKE